MLPKPESGEDGSQAWYVAEGERGEQLLNQSQVGQATEVFQGILTRLGDAPSYGRAVILGRLGRCFHMAGQPDLAVGHVRDAIDVIGRLAPSDGVKGLRGTLRSELGDALRAGGQYSDARKSYEAALKIAEELKDLRGQGVELGRLGALALAEGKLEEALARHQAARRLFQQLHDPDLEAATWHQLGKVYEALRQWDEAERHYREAARISEQRGRLAAAAQTWNQLAVLLQKAGSSLTPGSWPKRRWPSRTVSILRQRTPGRATAFSRTLPTERLGWPRTANRGPRWSCRHATIARLSATRRSRSPPWLESVKRRPSPGP